MGTREVVILLYTFVLPLLAIVFDDAMWSRKKPQETVKVTRTTTTRSQDESSRIPPGVAHQL